MNWKHQGEVVILSLIVIIYCIINTKRNFKRGGSLDSPDQVKKNYNKFYQYKKKCFQYAVTVVLNYKQIKKYPQRITKITPFIVK